MTDEQSIAVAVREREGYRLMTTVQEIQARADLIDACKAQAMKPGVHYGIIPGTGSKPTLLKPGAEKLDVLFQLRPEFTDSEEREPDGHLTITSYCTLVHIPTGDALVKDASGSCSTHESKYAWRKGERTCPECGQPAILKSKHDPEWFCWNKRGGCGSKFDIMDPRIVNQVTGRIPNPDLPDQWNTVRKMSQKRAHIAATLAATAASDVFTQDLEDMVDGEADTHPEGSQTARPAAQTRPAPKAASVVNGSREDFDLSASEAPASRDPIPDADPTRPLVAAVNALAGSLDYSPAKVANVATVLFKRNVGAKDLPGLSDADAERLAGELQARWDAAQAKEAS